MTITKKKKKKRKRLKNATHEIITASVKKWNSSVLQCRNALSADTDGMAINKDPVSGSQ